MKKRKEERSVSEQACQGRGGGGGGFAWFGLATETFSSLKRTPTQGVRESLLEGAACSVKQSTTISYSDRGTAPPRGQGGGMHTSFPLRAGTFPYLPMNEGSFSRPWAPFPCQVQDENNVERFFYGCCGIERISRAKSALGRRWTYTQTQPECPRECRAQARLCRVIAISVADTQRIKKSHCHDKHFLHFIWYFGVLLYGYD